MLFVMATVFSMEAQTVEYKIITSVESIVPNGLGRSRLLSANDLKDYKAYTTTQTEDDNTRNKSDRKEMRVKGFDETKLLNVNNSIESASSYIALYEVSNLFDS